LILGPLCLQGAGYSRRKSRIYSDSIRGEILLSEFYEKSIPKKSTTIQQVGNAYIDSLDDLRIQTGLVFIDYDEQERQYEIEAANIAYRVFQVQSAYDFSISIALISLLMKRRTKKTHKDTDNF
jgi:hypothetical protein